MQHESPARYETLDVVGTVSVELVERLTGTMEAPTVILLLGPTGAGKSTFIESLASDNTLRISSNQLEGFTRSISAYRLVNVERQTYRNPIYLIDIPGFADTKISEMRILTMLKDWIATERLLNVYRMLYLTPINTPRLAGSHRRVIQAFQSLTGIQSAEGVTVISTMWDCVQWSEKAMKRAESNFNQLHNEIWKEYVDKGTKILKFYNTQESALSIIDEAFNRFSLPDLNIRRIVDPTCQIRETSFGTSIYNDLQAHIENTCTELANIQADLLTASEHEDTQLIAVLVPQIEQVQTLLATYEQEMHDFGPPPDAPEISHQPASDPVTSAMVISSQTPVPEPQETPLKLINNPQLALVNSSLKMGPDSTSGPAPQTLDPTPHDPNSDLMPNQPGTSMSPKKIITKCLNWMKRLPKTLGKRRDV